MNEYMASWLNNQLANKLHYWLFLPSLNATSPLHCAVHCIAEVYLASSTGAILHSADSGTYAYVTVTATASSTVIMSTYIIADHFIIAQFLMMLVLTDHLLHSLYAVSYLCWLAMPCFLCSLYRIGPYQTFFKRIVTFNMICFLPLLGNTWTVDATFQDTEFTQIAMYSPTRGIASTSQSVLHSHNIGELRVWV